MAPATNTSIQATDNSVGDEHEVNTSQESEKQRLEREEEDRLRERNSKKESVKQVYFYQTYLSSKNMPILAYIDRFIIKTNDSSVFIYSIVTFRVVIIFHPH